MGFGPGRYPVLSADDLRLGLRLASVGGKRGAVPGRSAPVPGRKRHSARYPQEPGEFGGPAGSAVLAAAESQMGADGMAGRDPARDPRRRNAAPRRNLWGYGERGRRRGRRGEMDRGVCRNADG